MPYSQTTARRRRKGMVGPVVAIAGCAALFAGLAVVMHMHPLQPLDTHTLCLRDKPAPAHTAVLVDTTDALSTGQRAELEAAVEAARDRLPRHGRITIFFLRADRPYDPEKIISVCNPGSHSLSDGLLDNEGQIRRRWQKNFADRLDRAVKRLEVAGPAKSSPIMKAITALTWRPDFSASVKQRKLIVISDLLEYDPHEFTAYRGDRLWTRYVHSALRQEAPADLANVQVQAVLLHRTTALRIQGPHLMTFWRTWFASRGAATVAFGTDNPSAPGNQTPQLAMRH